MLKNIFRFCSSVQKVTMNKKVLFDCSDSIKNYKMIRKQKFRKGSLFFISSVILAKTAFFPLAVVTVLFATLNFSKWNLMLLNSRKLYINKILIFKENEQDKIFVSFRENGEFFVTKPKNLVYNGDFKEVPDRLENLENKEMSLFPFRIKDPFMCHDRLSIFKFDKQNFYLLLDRTNEKILLDKQNLENLIFNKDFNYD
jgi:hypothetical protein